VSRSIQLERCSDDVGTEMTSFATFCSVTRRRVSAFLADDRAATAVEYAMIAAGIAAAVAATVFTLGTEVRDKLYQKISDGLP
jgi:pilus assembly protein Flp/PilA